LLVPRLEKQVGIEVYATKSLGIDGVIRRSIDDFVVEEVLVDGSRAEIKPSAERGALGSSSTQNRCLLCVLVKRNWDTLYAMKTVADQLGISMGRIHTGGMKDAKAITAQHITIEEASIEDAKKVHVKDIELRPLGYVRGRLSSYYLLGNSFRITISSISHLKSTIKKRIAQTVEELQSVGGIPNFFGHQRFGTTRPITHLVGKAIVKGDFEKAAMLFLAKPSPHEHPSSRLAREALRETQDCRQALRDFPRQLRYERLMLRHLAERKDDYVGAFKQLPVKLQKLFPQAYQSYLFNRFLSRRIQAGLLLDRTEVGDYVVTVERSSLPMVTMFKAVTVENRVQINKDIRAGKMRLALPLIGLKQSASLGAQGDIEKQVLEQEGIANEDFRIPEMPAVSSRGELRSATTLLNGFSLDEIACDSDDPSKHEAKVSFALHRGSYATIVLRELMKTRNPIEAGF
jgi:tRNA pseudouridine13 synthase